MKDSDNLKDELIKQMNAGSGTTSDSGKLPDQILAVDTARVRRLKWVTIFSWMLCGLLFILETALEHGHYFLLMELVEDTFPGFRESVEPVLFCLPLVLRAILFICIFLTIMLYIRAKTLTMRQIQARLASIEMLLKKIGDDQ